MKYFFLFIYFISCHVFASSLSLELSNVSTQYNYFELPNSQSNRVDLPNSESLLGVRLTGFFTTKNNNKIYFLVAPFTARYNFESTKSFTFNDTIFSQGVDTKVSYKFNSYRIGYFWAHTFNNIELWYGGSLKIRDAFIKVSQSSTSDKFTNIGIVPLLGFGFEAHLWQSFALYHHTDALGSSQGSAYDSQLDLRFYLSASSVLSVGGRILGGGAENDTLENFAQFTYITAGYTHKF